MTVEGQKMILGWLDEVHIGPGEYGPNLMHHVRRRRRDLLFEAWRQSVEIPPAPARDYVRKYRDRSVSELKAAMDAALRADAQSNALL